MKLNEPKAQSPAVGMFGQMWLEALKESDPASYAELERRNLLNDLAQKADAKAEAMYAEVLTSLEKSHPPPKDYEGRAQALSVLANQAREIVLNDILPRSEKDRLAESQGYVDEEPKEPKGPLVSIPTAR